MRCLGRLDRRVETEATHGLGDLLGLTPGEARPGEVALARVEQRAGLGGVLPDYPAQASLQRLSGDNECRIARVPLPENRSQGCSALTLLGARDAV